MEKYSVITEISLSLLIVASSPKVVKTDILGKRLSKKAVTRREKEETENKKKFPVGISCLFKVISQTISA